MDKIVLNTQNKKKTTNIAFEAQKSIRFLGKACSLQQDKVYRLANIILAKLNSNKAAHILGPALMFVAFKVGRQ